MKIKDLLNESAKPKISKITGNEFIQFKVPAKLNTTKNIAKEILKIANKIDTEAMAYVGVPLSGLIIKDDGDFELTKHILFKSSDGKLCKVYGADTENPNGFSIFIAKLCDESIKKIGAAPTLVEPKAFVMTAHLARGWGV